jgi:plastocyanin
MKRTALAAVLLGALAACSNTTPPAGDSADTSPIASAESSATSPLGTDGVTVTGVEYAYEGVPESAKAGTMVTFVNGGNEVHEIVAIRRNEGVTTTLEELLAMPEEESNKLVSFLGVAVASPGETAPEMITLDQPGGYIFICFIPVGTTELPSLAPDATPNESLLPDGPPHFVQGMVAEFSVIE